MASGAGKVFIDTEKAAGAAANLTYLVEKLADTLDNLSASELVDGTNWSGKARDEFVLCCNDLYTECGKVKKRIDSRAKGIAAAVAAYKQMDSDFATSLDNAIQEMNEAAETSQTFPSL
jgi:hypothetical protein